MDEMCKRNTIDVTKFVEGKIRSFRLEAPETKILADIVAAGKGEHQDRLWSKAVKKSIVKFMDEVFTEAEARYTMHKAEYHGGDGSRHENGLPSREEVVSWLS